MFVSFARRAAATSALALVLFSSTALAAPQEGFGSPVPVDALLPAKTLGTLMISGEPCERAGDDLALTKIWNEEEVQAFVGPALQTLEGLSAAGWWQVQAMTGLSQEAVESLRNARVTAGVLGFRALEYGGTVDFALSVEFSHDQHDNVMDLLDTLESTIASTGMGHFEAAELGGREVRRMVLPMADGLAVSYAVSDGLVLFSSSDEDMAGMMQRLDGARTASLASNGNYAETKRWSRTDNSFLHVYVDVERVFDLITSIDDDDEIRALASMLPYSAFGWGEDIDGAGIRDRVYTHMSDTSILDAMLASGDGVLHAHTIVPADTPVYWGARFDMQGYFDGIVQMLSSMDARVGAEVDGHLAEVREHTGIDVRTVLGAIGPEVAFYASLPGRSLVPDFGLLLEVQDKEQVDELIARVHALTGVNNPIRTMEYRGHTISYVNTNDNHDMNDLLDGPSIRPTWAYVDCYLLVTLWPNAAKNLIANHVDGGASLHDSAEFQKTLAGMTAPAAGSYYDSLMWVDLRRAAEFVLDNGEPFLQSMVPDVPMVPIDIARWPRTEVITQHLFGLAAVSRRTESGLYAEMYSPTGMVPLVLPLAGAAVIASQRTMMAMEYEAGIQADRAAAEYGEF